MTGLAGTGIFCLWFFLSYETPVPASLEQVQLILFLLVGISLLCQ